MALWPHLLQCIQVFLELAACPLSCVKAASKRNETGPWLPASVCALSIIPKCAAWPLVPGVKGAL